MITVLGGRPSVHTTFTVTGFSAGTTGMTAGAIAINAAASTITIHGTPTASGTVSFTVKVVRPAAAV